MWDDFQRILASLKSEGRVIRKTPFSFVFFLAIGAVVIWNALSWRYSGQIENLESTVAAKDALLAEYKEKLGGATPSEAKQRIERLEQAVTPRRLSDKQKDLMAAELAKAKASITIEQFVKVTDASRFQKDLAMLFSYLGWQIHGISESGQFEPPAPSGLAMLVADARHLTAPESVVKKALDAADIKYDIVQMGKPTGVGNVYLVITRVNRS